MAYIVAFARRNVVVKAVMLHGKTGVLRVRIQFVPWFVRERAGGGAIPIYVAICGIIDIPSRHIAVSASFLLSEVGMIRAYKYSLIDGC
jgi:hypothetical protein